MFAMLGKCRLELAHGDITLQGVDAIVNAANAQLLVGGGVDGAIHRAAGPTLEQELRRNSPGGCPTGSAVATNGGNLSAKYVFHAVGPIWRGGQHQEAELLSGAIRQSLELARARKCRSIAFPAISTGIYGYPKDLAAEVSLSTVRDELKRCGEPELVRFVLFDEGTYGAFARVLERMLA